MDKPTASTLPTYLPLPDTTSLVHNRRYQPLDESDGGDYFSSHYRCHHTWHHQQRHNTHRHNGGHDNNNNNNKLRHHTAPGVYYPTSDLSSYDGDNDDEVNDQAAGVGKITDGNGNRNRNGNGNGNAQAAPIPIISSSKHQSESLSHHHHHHHHHHNHRLRRRRRRQRPRANTHAEGEKIYHRTLGGGNGEGEGDIWFFEWSPTPDDNDDDKDEESSSNVIDSNHHNKTALERRRSDWKGIGPHSPVVVVVKEKEEKRGCDRGEEQEEEEEDRSWWSYKLDNGHGEERRRNDDNNTHPGYVTPRTQELWSLDGNKRKGSGLEERGLREPKQFPDSTTSHPQPPRHPLYQRPHHQTRHSEGFIITKPNTTISTITTLHRSQTMRHIPNLQPLSPSSNTNSSQSNPIAIQTRKKSDHQAGLPRGLESTLASAEPLSARGDLQGAYFPLHEDPRRCRITHPFSRDVEQARHASIQLAAKCSSNSSSIGSQSAHNNNINHNNNHYYHYSSSSSSSCSGTSSLAGSPVVPHPLLQGRRQQTQTQSRISAGQSQPSSEQEDTIFGDDDDDDDDDDIPPGVVIPKGKYYPTNWEKRHNQPKLQGPVTMPRRVAPYPRLFEDQDQPGRGRRSQETSLTRQQQQHYHHHHHHHHHHQQDPSAAAAAAAAAAVPRSAMSAASSLSSTNLSPRSSRPRIVPMGLFPQPKSPASPQLGPIDFPVERPGAATSISLDRETYKY